MIENLDVQNKRSDLTASWWRGYDEGYHAKPAPLPEWTSKPYNRFTAYERGFVFGMQMKEHEGDIAP